MALLMEASIPEDLPLFTWMIRDFEGRNPQKQIKDEAYRHPQWYRSRMCALKW